MPWTRKQQALFRGIAGGSIKPRKGLSVGKARELAEEGVRASSSSGKARKKS